MDQDDPEQPEPTGSIIPVFVTADVPVEVLNQLLQDDARRRLEESFRLHIVRSTDPDYLASVRERSRPPAESTASSASPFLGWTLKELNDWFLDNIQPLVMDRSRFSWWTYCSFLVVDEYSAATGSVYVVTADEKKRTTTSPAAAGEEVGLDALPPGSKEPRSPQSKWTYVEDETDPERLRCSFSVARHVATPVEVQGFGLWEHIDEDQIAIIQTGMQVYLEF